MKKIALFFAALVLLFASVGWASDSSYTTKFYVQQGGDRAVVASGGSLDVESGGEIDIESGGSLKLNGTAVTATAATINRLPSADGTVGQYLQTNGAGAWSFQNGTSGSLDDAYNNGASVTVDAGAVTLTNNAANNNGVLAIEKSPIGAQSGDAVTITVGGNSTGDALQFVNSGSGNDIAGTGGTWSVTKAGVATFSSFGGLTSGLTVSGGEVNLNASSNNATNLNTGTSAGAVSIGGGSGTVAVNSSSWDISTAGAVSGLTTVEMSGNLTNTGGDLVVSTGKGLKGSTTTAETVNFMAYDVDNTTYRNVIQATNGNTIAVTIGTNNETVAINSSDWDISTTGDMTGIGAITMDGLLTGTAGATISGGTINLNASSNNAVNIGTGTTTSTVTIGGNGAQTIAVGDGAAAKTVSLGSSNTTSTTTLLSGSGGLNLNASNNQPTNINTGTSTGTVTIGNSTGPAILTAIGTVTVNHDAAAMTTGIGTGTTTGTITIGGAGAQTLDIGNGAAAKTVNLGSSNTTSATALLSGSGGVKVNENNNQPVDIGTGTSTGTVTIGGAGVQSIAIGNGAAAKTVALGSSNTTSTTTISAGSGKINLVGEVSTGDAITGDGTAALGGFLNTVTNDADGKNLAITECGTTQTNAGAVGGGVWNLPEASTAIGCRITFVTMAAQNFDINPDDADKILGLTDAAGDAIRNATVGNTVTLQAVDATNWAVISNYGTWTDVN